MYARVLHIIERMYSLSFFGKTTCTTVVLTVTALSCTLTSSMFTVLSAILHIGNVTFQKVRN